MSPRQSLHQKLEACDRKRRELTARLSELGYIWPGTLLQRRLPCGKPGCACKRDPDARHGPYAYWTTKVGGKTVTRLLTPLEVALYGDWINNRRELDRILAELKRLSQAVAPLLLKLRSTESK